MKPLLFVTGHVPAYRIGALAALHQREGIEVALFGGSSKHGGAESAGALPFPCLHVGARQLAQLTASSHYRAVVLPTGGRLALLGAWAGARRSHTPLILWASLWAHPRSAAHAVSYFPLRRLYHSAEAVVTYGPHVSAYVRERGAANVQVAPQSVDNDFWSSPGIAPPCWPEWPKQAEVRFLFVGRAAPEKGLEVLLAAWEATNLAPSRAALIVAGPPASSIGLDGDPDQGKKSVVALERLSPTELREVYAACEVLVVPSIPTRTFREPWGLVVNEAMNRGLAVIATDAVGAAAGGLVRDGESGLVVPAGDVGALSGAISRLTEDERLRERLGAAGTREVAAYSYEAWAEGFSSALSSLGLSRERW